MFRFLIRDLLWLTVVVGILFSGFGNARPVAALIERWSANVWDGMVKTGRPPLMGRDSVQPDR